MEQTLAELALCAARVSAGLVELGVEPEEPVALTGASSASLVAGFFGVLGAGASVVPLHERASSSDIERAQALGVRHIIGSGPHATISLEQLLASELTERSAARLHSRTLVAMLLSTSGTTGSTKTVAVSHASLLTHTRAAAKALTLSPGDNVLAALPVAHSFGIRMTVLAPLVVGARFTIAGARSPEEMLALCEQEAVSALMGVPTMYCDWAATEGTPLSALRFGLSAGASLAKPIQIQASARLGAPVYEGYGLTEATFSTIDSPGKAPRVGSVGEPVGDVELRVEADGEILVRGSNAMLGYVGDDSATRAATTQDGFIRTGDIGAIEDGALFVRDRKKDLVLRGGYNIAPSEVEAVALGLHGVCGAAAFGVPDQRLGERLILAIVGDANEPRLREQIKTRLGGHKTPDQVIRLDALPKTRSGKIARRVLREQFRDEH